jgi:hypothetical protein
VLESKAHHFLGAQPLVKNDPGRVVEGRIGPCVLFFPFASISSNLDRAVEKQLASAAAVTT